MNNVYACGLLEDVNIEPEQDVKDPSKINVHVVVKELEPRSMEVCVTVGVGQAGGGRAYRSEGSGAKWEHRGHV